MRRRATVAIALASVLPYRLALAQTKTLKLVVPYPAGGTADVLPRIVAEKLHTTYPGGVIVENRPGAGGNIGGELVFHADPDGSVLLASPPGPIAINQSLYPKMPFDPAKWVPVTLLASVPNVLVVGPSVPAKNLQELLAYIRARPGKVSFASQGNGTTSHLTASLFMSLTGTEMIHVPYKGTAPALSDLMGGHVDIFFDNLASSLPQYRGGRLKILAVAATHRAAAAKDIPTFAELGLPGMVSVTWFAVMAPPGTPEAIALAAQQAIAAALKLPDVQQRFADQGAEPHGYTPAETGAFVKAETEKWRKVIKRANVTIE